VFWYPPFVFASYSLFCACKDTILAPCNIADSQLGAGWGKTAICFYICLKTKLLGLFLYNIFLGLYAIGSRIASLSNKKAKLWLAGRKNIFSASAGWRREMGAEAKVVWVHCASLGEFEQGRPVLEKIKEKYPGYKIMLSFFSPSGYEVRKNYPGADGIFYLPADGRKNAARFIDIIKPSLVIWVKYEYWYYYLTAFKEKNIPVVLISALFRPEQPFFKWYGGIWRKMLHCFYKIFVQDAASAEMLKTKNLYATAVPAGDTRFDRVIAIAEKHEPLPEAINEFCAGHQVIVAGSTWEEDEEEIVHYMRTHPAIKLILAPHEIDEERLHDAKKMFGHAVYYSEFITGNTDAQVLIIDNIGMLSKLYLLADIAYIGGGFNDSGIHNITEAAVYGKPVIFGPEYEKFNEAIELIDRGGAFSIENALELEALLDKLFGNEELLRKASATAKKYIYEKQGATGIVMEYIYEKRLLIS
jgi:3-deoxy-D-manno-octulosonic-acid transferase